MTIGAMLGDILESLFKKPVTERYPFERKATPERLRGKLYWEPEKCSGCQLCVKDCPANAIELIVLDKVAKRFVMRYNPDRCTFCGECVESCRFDCLGLSSEDWELAALNRDSFEVFFGKDEDVETLMAQIASQYPGNTKE
jgi:NAD(P)H-quinone oxidoreductase subunit I